MGDRVRSVRGLSHLGAAIGFASPVNGQNGSADDDRRRCSHSLSDRHWFDIRWCASLGVATGTVATLPVVRAEAGPCLRSTPPAAFARSHRHPCVTTWADGQSGRTLSGELAHHAMLRYSRSATGTCCASGGVCGERWRHRLLAEQVPPPCSNNGRWSVIRR